MEPIYINVITSPNCPYSPKAVKIARKVTTKKYGAQVCIREVSIVTPEGENMAESYRLDSTPAFTINGKVAFVGVPEVSLLSKLIKDEIHNERCRSSYFF